MKKTLVGKVKRGNEYKVPLDYLIEKDRKNYESKLDEWASGSITKPEKKKISPVGLIKKIIAGTVLASTLLTACPVPYFPEEPATKIQNPTPTPEQPAPTQELDYVNFSGQLQNNETGLGVPDGVIRVYGTRTDNGDGTFSYDNLLGESVTNSSGNYSVTLDKIVNSGEDIYIRANTENNSLSTSSYITTQKISAEDATGINLGVTPFDSDFDGDFYADLDRNKDGTISLQEKLDFREHVGRTNVWSTSEKYDIGIEGVINGNPWHGVKKWNRGELGNTLAHPIFQGYKIDTTQFSEEELNDFENIIHTSDYPGASELKIVREANPVSNFGWITVYHSEEGEGPYAKSWDGFGEDGYLEYAKVYLNTITPLVVRHEGIWHGMGYSGHSNCYEVPALFDSLGAYAGGPTDVTAVDIKEDYVIKNNSGMTNLDDVLGLSE